MNLNISGDKDLWTVKPSEACSGPCSIDLCCMRHTSVTSAAWLRPLSSATRGPDTAAAYHSVFCAWRNMARMGWWFSLNNWVKCIQMWLIVMCHWKELWRYPKNNTQTTYNKKFWTVNFNTHRFRLLQHRFLCCAAEKYAARHDVILEMTQWGGRD